jgi:ferredoxin
MMRVWIDPDLCTGDGLCNDHCPEMFKILEDGISYVRDVATGEMATDPGGRSSLVHVPERHERYVIDAAVECPGECIFIEEDATYLGPAKRGSGRDDDRDVAGADIR